MRTRLIRPEFFADELIGSLAIPTRLCYIGLWTLADDAGYFELGTRQLAAELFRYDAPAARERTVVAALAALVKATRVRLLDCGVHAVIPTIPDHRIKGGEQLFTVKKRHERRCSGSSTVGLHSPGATVGLHSPTENSVSESVSDSDSVSVSNSAHARRKELGDAARDAGGFVANLEARRRPNGEAGS